VAKAAREEEGKVVRPPQRWNTTVIGGDWRMCALCHECDHCMVIGSVVSGIWARSPVHAVGNRRGPLTGGPGPVK
jgi:hypothetical protein